MKSFESLKVLLVDDLQELREDMKKILVQLDIRDVKEAYDGQNGLEVFVSDQFDLVISDINMPNINGIEMAKKIRAGGHNKNVPIIICSTENEKNIIMDALLAGGNDYIIKPFDPPTVINKVTEVIKKFYS